MPNEFLQTAYSKGKPMKKEMLGKMKMPPKKKDPMLDLEATLAEIGQEKPDAEMDEMEDEDSSEYGKMEGPEMEVNIGGADGGEEGPGPGEEAGQDLSFFTDEELQQELDKRSSLASSKPAKKAPKL